MKPVFVLVHSPALGPHTWNPTADRLRSAGYGVRVPSLLRVGEGAPPYWPRIVSAVRDELGDPGDPADFNEVPGDVPLVLVAHSNAGLFLPTLRSELPHRVVGSVFVDAALPARSGPTPVAAPDMLEFLRPLAVDGVLPRWTDWWDEADVAPLFPDPTIRQAICDEQPNLPLAYYEQTVPVPRGWDDHPCSYLRFSHPYDALATEARERGWRVAHLPGAHLHQTVDPEGTARQLLDLTVGT